MASSVLNSMSGDSAADSFQKLMALPGKTAASIFLHIAVLTILFINIWTSFSGGNLFGGYGVFWLPWGKLFD
jgi:hypothetical protein